MEFYYFDSSGLVKRYVTEIGSKWVRGLLRPSAANEIYLANITSVEVVAAFSRRIRQRSLDSAQAAKAVRRFLRDSPNRFNFLRINDAIISAAVNLTQIHGLRGYDAVQLATTLEFRNRLSAPGLPPFVFVSADHDLNAAATAEGLSVDNPNNHP
jgi:predicted nucleic acid-binding protein